MKIAVTHSTSFNFQDDLYKPLRSSALNKNHQLFLPHENGQKFADTKNTIKESSLVIAEVSYPSTGQGIELGWANVFNVPIICMHKKDSVPSASLKLVTEKFIFYIDTEDMASKLIEEIKLYEI